MQQSCQSFCDQKCKDNHSYVSFNCSFHESLIQEQIDRNQFYEATSVEALDTQTSHIIKLQERNNPVYDALQTKTHEDNEDHRQIQSNVLFCQENVYDESKKNIKFTLNKDLMATHDSRGLELGRNNEEERVVLNPFESDNIIQDYTFFEVINSKILKKQIDIHDDLNEEINIWDIIVSIKSFHEYSKLLLVDNMNEDFIKEVAIFSFVNDSEFHNKNS